MERLEKSEWIQRLKQDILRMEGFKAMEDGTKPDFGLGPLEAAFPNSCFPVGAVHEVISSRVEDATAANGFICGLLHILMQHGGICLWIGNRRKVFPSALTAFGIEADRVLFVDLNREKDVLWVVEEALKCPVLTAVVAELNDLSFAQSRRLQLAVEESRVTGFIHRHFPRSENTVMCVSRWKVRPLPAVVEDGLPGMGFPRWEVQLAKIRNGKPGKWQLEWRENGFRFIEGQKKALVASMETVQAGGSYA